MQKIYIAHLCFEMSVCYDEYDGDDNDDGDVVDDDDDVVDDDDDDNDHFQLHRLYVEVLYTVQHRLGAACPRFLQS